jgi:hypothetical protein
MKTPWGTSQRQKKIASGITFYETARHGGFKVSPEKTQEMPPCLRNKDGWYEEDCEWAKVALSFKDLFTEPELVAAKELLCNYNPDAYETFYNEVIPEGKSRIKDQRIFDEVNKDNLVVVSAMTDSKREGMVRCWATKGGDRELIRTESERIFLIPEEEYRSRGNMSYVIEDETKFEEITNVLNDSFEEKGFRP